MKVPKNLLCRKIGQSTDFFLVPFPFPAFFPPRGTLLESMEETCNGIELGKEVEVLSSSMKAILFSGVVYTRQVQYEWSMTRCWLGLFPAISFNYPLRRPCAAVPARSFYGRSKQLTQAAQDTRTTVSSPDRPCVLTSRHLWKRKNYDSNIQGNMMYCLLFIKTGDFFNFKSTVVYGLNSVLWTCR